MTDMLWISLGAIIGANARYGVTLLALSISPTFPFGTLIVNLTGSFLIGVILTLLTERLLVDPLWRLLLVVGFLGSYTTISAYAAD